MQRQTMMEVYYPGAIVSETECLEVKSRDHANIKLSPRAFGYKFFDRVTQEATLEDGTKVPHVKSENYSVMYFPDGEIYTLAQVERLFPDLEILAANMRNNGYPAVVKTRRGNWMPFNSGEAEIPATVVRQA